MPVADPRQPQSVRRMFDALSRRYDLANTAMTLGRHHAWKRQVVRRCALARGDSAIDLACGTGDIALRLKAAVGPEGRVAGVDFSEEMLAVARAKAQARGLDIEWLAADILALPFPAETFSAATIGFGVRNVSDRGRCLVEMARVLKPGGRLIVLETGQPRNALWRWLVHTAGGLYMTVVGGAVTGQPRAYAYLHSTTTAFPSGEKFTALLQAAARFSNVQARPLAGGLAWIYEATKAAPESR